MKALNEFDTLADAQAYEFSEMVRISGAEPKTAVETVNIFNGTRDRLAEYSPPSTLSAEQAAQASVLASMIVKALDNLFNPEFYIALDNPQVQGAYAGALALGVLTQAEYDGILAAGTKTSYPYANATQHQFLIAKNECPMRQLNTVGRYGVITTTADCEAHNPRVFALSENTGKFVKIANFSGVSEAGIYEVEIPSQYLNHELRVDDAYGVIAEG